MVRSSIRYQPAFPGREYESKIQLSERDGSIINIQMLLASSSYFVCAGQNASAGYNTAGDLWMNLVVAIDALSPDAGFRPFEFDDFSGPSSKIQLPHCLASQPTRIYKK